MILNKFALVILCSLAVAFVSGQELRGAATPLHPEDRALKKAKEGAGVDNGDINKAAGDNAKKENKKKKVKKNEGTGLYSMPMPNFTGSANGGVYRPDKVACIPGVGKVLGNGNRVPCDDINTANLDTVSVAKDNQGDKAVPESDKSPVIVTSSMAKDPIVFNRVELNNICANTVGCCTSHDECTSGCCGGFKGCIPVNTAAHEFMVAQGFCS